MDAIKNLFDNTFAARPFVDIHCHLAAGLDDGPNSWDETLHMAELALADGISTVIVTPHQLGRHARNSATAVRHAVKQLKEMLLQHHLPLRVLPGADVRIEADLPKRIAADEVLTLADRRQYVLLELPHEVYLPLEGLLRELSRMGIVGILSHPERNQGILRRPEVLRRLAVAGCLFQITTGSLTGEFGSAVQRFAETLLKEKLVHFVATDAHGSKYRTPKMSEAFQRIADLEGKETAVNLCCHNPEAIVTGSRNLALAQNVAKPEKTAWFCKSFSSIQALNTSIKER